MTHDVWNGLENILHNPFMKRNQHANIWKQEMNILDNF